MLERHASVSQSVATTKPGRSPIPRELLIQPGCSVDLLRSFFVLFGGKHATLTFCHDTKPSNKTTTHERQHTPTLSIVGVVSNPFEGCFSHPSCIFENRRLTFAATGLHGDNVSTRQYSLGVGRRLTQHNTGLQVSPWRRLCPTPTTLAPLAPAPGPLHAMPPHTQLATYLAPC